MDLNISSKVGKIQLDNGTLQVVQVFGKVLWQVPAESITGFVTRPGALMSIDVTIESTQGSFLTEMVSKPNFAKLCASFPNIQVIAADPISKPVRPKKLEWYESPDALTHVASYTKEKEMQHDIEAAYQHGWMIQGQSTAGSHVNVGRAVTKAVLTGAIGLMTGVSRSKEKTTIVYVRTPEWLASQK